MLACCDSSALLGAIPEPEADRRVAGAPGRQMRHSNEEPVGHQDILPNQRGPSNRGPWVRSRACKRAVRAVVPQLLLEVSRLRGEVAMTKAHVSYLAAVLPNCA